MPIRPVTQSDSSWENTTVLRKTTSQLKKMKQPTTAEKKDHVLPANKQKTNDLYARKVDDLNDAGSHAKVPLSLAQTIAKVRADKGMNRKDFALKIGEKEAIVGEYETGKAIPNQQILGKMERALGVKLRGKNIGDPLEFKSKTKK